MTVVSTVLFCAAALVIGLAIGGYVAAEYLNRFYAKFQSSAAELQHRADAAVRLALLADLRAGRPDDAARRLERTLDGDVLALGALLEGSAHRADSLAVLRRVAELRAQGGYEPDPRVARQVGEALAKAQAASGAPAPAASLKRAA